MQYSILTDKFQSLLKSKPAAHTVASCANHCPWLVPWYASQKATKQNYVQRNPFRPKGSERPLLGSYGKNGKIQEKIRCGAKGSKIHFYRQFE